MAKVVVGGITLRFRPHQSAAEVILPAQIEKGFAQNLQKALIMADNNRCPQLAVRCNGGGGLVSEFERAFPMLHQRRYEVITLVASGRGYDRADSAHAGLWLAGKRRLMMPGTSLALHAAQYEPGAQQPATPFHRGLNRGFTHGIFQKAARQTLPLSWFQEEYTLVSAEQAQKFGLCQVVSS